ncbi:hypothetical protein GQ457_13G017010 [Hibiscus cannabinus]
MVEGVEEDGEIEEFLYYEESGDVQDSGKGENPVISLQAMWGSEAWETMKLRIRIGGFQCIALLDSGNTHNLFSLAMVKRAGLGMRMRKQLKVSVADGNVMGTLGECPGVTWEVHNQRFETDFLVLPLKNYDMLDVHWRHPLTLCFPSLLWQVWKRRNVFIFNDVCSPLVEVYRVMLAWASYFIETFPPTLSLSPGIRAPHQWKPPDPGWVCLNFDADVSYMDGMGSIRRVFHNSLGNWVHGYSKTVGVLSSLQAELWDILISLQVAYTIGIDSLLVQSNNSTDIQLVFDPLADNSSLRLVCPIKSFKDRNWSLEFKWLPREENKVADYTSKLSSHYHFHILQLDDALEHARPTLT